MYRNCVRKRRLSFDDSPLQTKMRIGIKEVNLGVNREENMKLVYARTQKLLFNGASQSLNAFPCPSSEIPKESTSSLQNGVHLHKNGVSEQNGSKPVLKNCCLQKSVKIACSFCEKAICCECMRICCLCSGEFCDLCSVLQYSSQEEAAMCLSCFK